jgi:hypothetical protein
MSKCIPKMCGGRAGSIRSDVLRELLCGAFGKEEALPIVFFSPHFLCEPPPGWEVVCGDPDDEATGWMAPGTLVKLDCPPRVWRLSGHVDFTTGYMEGVWPD